jgi:hypothetical protein
MHNRCAIDVQSLCIRCAITLQSMHNRCAIDAQSLCIRCAFTLQSIRNHSAIDAQSLSDRCAITAQSLRNHITIVAQSHCNLDQFAVKYQIREEFYRHARLRTKILQINEGESRAKQQIIAGLRAGKRAIPSNMCSRNF